MVFVGDGHTAALNCLKLADSGTGVVVIVAGGWTTVHPRYWPQVVLQVSAASPPQFLRRELGAMLQKVWHERRRLP